MKQGRARFAAMVIGALLTGCGGAEEAEPAPESAPVAAEPSPELTPPALVGTWDVRAWNEAGDSLPGFRMVATPDLTGWTMNFTGRPVMPMRASVAGDTVTAEFGPYESVLRPGVTVTTTVVSHLEAERLVGSLLARYAGVTGPDSILRGRTEATRAP